MSRETQSYNKLAPADAEAGEESSEAESEEGLIGNYFGFLMDARDGFLVANKTALQVASWVTIGAAFAVFTRRHQLDSWGFSASTILCNVLFQVGSDIGSTVKNIYYAVIGSLIAWFVYWVFLGFFPNGYDGTNDGVWWGSMALIFLFTFGLVFLKINETVRFWALISFTGGFAMNLVKPGVEDPHPTGGFKFDYRGAAENGIILILVAGCYSILIFAIPPVLSLNRSQKRVLAVLKKLKLNLLALNKYYSRSTANMEIISIKEDFAILTADLAEAEGYGASSWFESLGTSSRRTLTIKLTSLIRDLLETATPLFTTVSEEDFGKSHQMMMRHIQQPMTDVVNSTMHMVEMLIDACEDGEVSKKEKADLEAEINSIPLKVDLLQKQVQLATAEFGTNKIQQEVLGEHYVVLTVCYLAQQVKDQSEFFLDFKGGESICDEMTDGFGSLFTYDRGDVRWALRSSLCLLTNFLIGWHGWCDWDALKEYKLNPVGEAPECFINEFTTGLANINVILLSRYGGGTLKAALERVSAVVFSSVVGQVGYVALGWCDNTARMLTVVTVFFVTWAFMYLNYDGSPDVQAIAQRLAAITVSSLMGACSNESGTAKTYSGQYHSLSEIILGVLVMTAFDTLLGDKPSQVQAKDYLKEAVTKFEQVYEGYFSNKIHHEDLAAEIGVVQGSLSTAKTLAGIAVLEPRFWRPSFASSLYNSIITSYETFCAEMLKMNRVLEDDKDLLLDNLPCYARVKKSMFTVLEKTTEYAEKTTWGRDEDAITELSKEDIEAEPEIVGMLVADMNRQMQQPQMKNRPGEMPVSPDSRRSAVATMIQSLVKGMTDLQRRCVKSKFSA